MKPRPGNPDPPVPGPDVPAADLPFEAALARLEAVVSALEDEGLSLDASIARFEEGLTLLKACRNRLEGAELRVRELLGDDAPAGKA